MIELATAVPEALEEDTLLKSLKDLLESKPALLERLLVVVGRSRVALFKRLTH